MSAPTLLSAVKTLTTAPCAIRGGDVLVNLTYASIRVIHIGEPAGYWINLDCGDQRLFGEAGASLPDLWGKALDRLERLARELPVAHAIVSAKP